MGSRTHAWSMEAYMYMYMYMLLCNQSVEHLTAAHYAARCQSAVPLRSE